MQSLKNKMPGNRISAHMMALRKKHKRAGAHKPPLKQKHAKMAGSSKGGR
jgi:hypothetical protein